MPKPSAVKAPPAMKAPNQGDAVQGIRTTDNPSPLEMFWRRRDQLSHVIPYDQLTVRKGLRVYDEMLLGDETISYAWNLKRMALLRSPWSLRCPTDRDGDPLPGSEAVRDHVQAHIERWGGFEAFLAMAIDGLRQGFKLGEIVTKEATIGGRRVWTIADILVRNSRFFAFDVDEAGRLKPEGVLEYVGSAGPDSSGIASTWSPSDMKAHATERFFRWTWNPLDSNAYSLYGLSDFRSIYRAYFLGDVLLKDWGATLDTYQFPIPIGISRENLTPTQRQDFLDALVQAIKRKALVVPAEYLPQGMDPEKAIRFHEVEGKADGFATAAEYLDKLKMRGVMIGQLVSDTGTKGGGAYALGTQHVMMFLTAVGMIGRSLGAAVSDTVFRRIVEWNLGEEAADLTPSLIWNCVGDEQTKIRADIVDVLIKNGAVNPAEKWIREYVGDLPPPDEETQALLEADRTAKTETAKQAPELERKKVEKPAPVPGGLSLEDEPPGKGAGPGAHSHRADPEVLRVELKVDAGGIEAAQDERLARFAAQHHAAWVAVFEDLGKQVKDAMAGPGVPGQFTIDTAPVEQVAFRFAVESMVAGAVDAMREVNRGQDRLARPGLLSVEALAEDDDVPPVAVLPAAAPFAGTLDLVAFAKAHGVDLPDLLQEFGKKIRLRQEDLVAFAGNRMAEVRGEIQEQIARLRNELRQQVIAAQAEGRVAADLLRNEFREMETRWAGMEHALGNETSALYDTLQSSAYNEGRQRLYAAAPAHVVIGQLYSAIIDGRTTRFCQVWDGYAAPRGDPVWRRVWPPNHWRCRSIVVAVLAGEMTQAELEARAQRMPSERPHKGFGGARFVPTVP